MLQQLAQDSLAAVMRAHPIFGQRVLCESVVKSQQVFYSLPAKSGSILVVQVPLHGEGQWAWLTAHPRPKWSHPLLQVVVSSLSITCLG